MLWIDKTSINPSLGIASLFLKLINLSLIYSSFSYRKDHESKACQKHRYAQVYRYIIINQYSIVQSPLNETIWKFGTGDIPWHSRMWSCPLDQGSTMECLIWSCPWSHHRVTFFTFFELSLTFFIFLPWTFIRSAISKK